ncbi:hypothetical protein PAHAL_1G310100 [Panicum hallii]|uniref:Uncharacterized protein n=1 Tax=Panicum hallii TaxID=206008 RepID=A0A2T8KWW8_9POAL|nr:uncharacterized protein LOC112902181 [Panicum hallii]PVH66666.1 hypothetical protein PAHAL_1G310100 [Panicum hallii]
MESRRHHHRSRSARGPTPVPPHPHLQPQHRHHRQNPSLSPAAAAHIFRPRHPMDDDAISTLMDIDDSPLGAAGAGFLDEDDGEGDMLLAPHRGGRGAGDARGPLHFAGFYNSFDGADFDDADIA